MQNNILALQRRYKRDGFISGVKIMDSASAASHRRAMEDAESKVGTLHYKTKVHTILKSPLELATSAAALDIVLSSVYVVSIIARNRSKWLHANDTW